MKHSGKAAAAALKLITCTLVALAGIILLCLLIKLMAVFATGFALVLTGLWILFVGFTLYFFRDPNPQVPADPKAIVAPAHGKVDVIDEITELEVMGGPCKRVSIFLSVVDVHVQQAPVAGKILQVTHKPGLFLNALKTESAMHNENVLIGFASSEAPGEKIGIRLIAGLIARRIIPWVTPGDAVARGERVSLIQFGSRVDIYLPLSTEVRVKLGDRTVGGETIVATRS